MGFNQTVSKISKDSAPPYHRTPQHPSLHQHQCSVSCKAALISQHQSSKCSPQIPYSKPKSARVKRALDEREAKVIENPKTAVFVRGNQISDRVSIALKELVSPSLSPPP